LRVIALIFQIWLIGKIGSSGIGLFELVMSVGALCATFAVSGIRFASTRLISEELGLGRAGSVRAAVERCIVYSLFFGAASCAVVLLFAERIGFLWIGDARTVKSLRVLALSLPFTALANVFAGYFTAVGRVSKSAAIQICEQLLRILLVVFMLSETRDGDVEANCLAVTAAGTLSCTVSCAVFAAVYYHDRRHHFPTGTPAERLTPRLLQIAVPLALSAYVRTALTTLEHLLIPRALKQAGNSSEAALSGFGTVHGMVFPIILFPSCLLSALAELLVPELTSAQVSGRDREISRAVSSLLRKSLAFSLATALFLYFTGDALGYLIYKSADAGSYIKIFAPLIPIMYLDMVTDGCLKGLGQMMWAMGVNIADSVLSIVLVLILVPRFGISGYVGVIYIAELMNFALSIGRLAHLTEIRLIPGFKKKKSV
jgi:stage V sporulation protein B